MKRLFGFTLILAALLVLAMLPVAAQEEANITGRALGLGDEVTGTLQAGQRPRYTLEDIDEAFDIVLFSEIDSVLYLNDEQGHLIEFEDYIFYGNEVFTWQPGDIKPAQIRIGSSGNNVALKYTLSILPAEQHISEDPKPGEEVKRWAELEVEQEGETQTVTLPYLLYVPEDYDENQQYPFILFMHGSGEAGTRLDFLKSGGLPKLIEDGEDYPFIIASPQLGYWEDWASKTAVVASFVEQLQSEFPIDPDRIYVTGLSLGGQGAWYFALAYPDLPAAVVSMAGYYQYGVYVVPENICDLADIPMWVFHGGHDEGVALTLEQGLVDAVKACGGDVRYTIYPDADHSATFEQGFADPALYEWLLEQHK